MNRPRTRNHFPRMKERGVRRRYRLRRALDVETIIALRRMGITLPTIRAALGGMTEALAAAEAQLVDLRRRFLLGMRPVGDVASALWDFPIAVPSSSDGQDLSGYVITDAFDRVLEPCSLCDDHVHDIENTACVCCQVHAPDPLGTVARTSDVLTLRCMAAEHEHCEGDFCECACHEVSRA